MVLSVPRERARVRSPARRAVRLRSVSSHGRVLPSGRVGHRSAGYAMGYEPGAGCRRRNRNGLGSRVDRTGRIYGITVCRHRAPVIRCRMALFFGWRLLVIDGRSIKAPRRGTLRAHEYGRQPRGRRLTDSHALVGRADRLVGSTRGRRWCGACRRLDVDKN